MARQKRVEPKTWEEFLAYEADQWRVHHSEEVIPEANYQFRLGQLVKYGSVA